MFFTLHHISDHASPISEFFTNFFRISPDEHMHRFFHSEQWLPYPVETVFAFFSNPHNLPRLMPEWQRACIEKLDIHSPPDETPTSTIAAGDGTKLTLSFRPIPFSPVRVRWDAVIGNFASNQQFCDTQVRGPFHFWHHCHKVRKTRKPESGEPGTLLRDEIEYELPLDPFSRIALPVVRAQFAAMFRFRQKRTAELLRQGTVKP